MFYLYTWNLRLRKAAFRVRSLSDLKAWFMRSKRGSDKISCQCRYPCL